MKPKVYIETTISGFYCDEQSEPDAAARREWTKVWRDHQRDKFSAATGPAALDGLNSRDYAADKRRKVLNLMNDLPLMGIDPEILEIARFCIQQKAMPSDPVKNASVLLWLHIIRTIFCLPELQVFSTRQ